MREMFMQCMREQFVINKNLNEFSDKAELKEGQCLFLTEKLRNFYGYCDVNALSLS
jgi:hypothetical protein